MSVADALLCRYVHVLNYSIDSSHALGKAMLEASSSPPC
jgi:hypothetical protein